MKHTKIVSEYDQEIPNHKLLTNPWHREEESQKNNETNQAKKPAHLDGEECNTLLQKAIS